MTTRSQYLERLRARLADPDAKRWSNDELLSYLDESVGMYSQLFPQTLEKEFTPDGFSNRFNVPDDLLDQWITMLWVILPTGSSFEVDGGINRLREPERRFEVVGQELVLNFIPASDTVIRIRYSGVYTIPDSGDARIPAEDETLIYLYAVYLAWLKISAQDASLSRWREEGRRNDSPIIPEATLRYREWEKLVNLKKDRGGFVLRTRGRRYGREYYRDF